MCYFHNSPKSNQIYKKGKKKNGATQSRVIEKKETIMNQNKTKRNANIITLTKSRFLLNFIFTVPLKENERVNF